MPTSRQLRYHRTLARAKACQRNHLGSGEQADRHARLFHRRKSWGDRVHEFARDELVVDFCRTVRYVLQAVVAHAGILLLVASSRKLDAGIEAELPCQAKPGLDDAPSVRPGDTNNRGAPDQTARAALIATMPLTRRVLPRL